MSVRAAERWRWHLVQSAFPSSSQRPADGNAPWYKDAIIYELHVRAFSDSNGDGIGDFEGLIDKLDYLHDLGVTAIWLLPFYPSPLRDDGLRHRRLHERQPSLRHLRGLPAAPRRGPPPRHPRHHRARDEPHVRPSTRGSSGPGAPRRAARSATSTSGATPRTATSDARIIFQDFETSNWTWDPVAQRVLLAPLLLATSRTSTSTTPRSDAAMFERRRLLARARGRRAAPRRGAVPVRARGHELREPARDARVPEEAPRARRREASRTACCSPRPTSGPRTPPRTSATATSAT